jgi:hypothetical protein
MSCGGHCPPYFSITDAVNEALRFLIRTTKETSGSTGTKKL